MAIKIRPYLIYTLVLLVLASCSIEKRQHLSGYNVDWKSKKSKKVELAEVQKTDEAKTKKTLKSTTSEIEDQSLSASTNDDFTVIDPKISPQKPKSIEFSLPIKKDSKIFRKIKKSVERRIDKLEATLDDPELEESKKVMAFGITGFVLGILGPMLVLFGPLSFFPLGILLAPTAIIFSAIALKKHKTNSSQKGCGLALAGLIIGIVGVVFYLIDLAVYFWLVYLIA